MDLKKNRLKIYFTVKNYMFSKIIHAHLQVEKKYKLEFRLDETQQNILWSPCRTHYILFVKILRFIF